MHILKHTLTAIFIALFLSACSGPTTFLLNSDTTKNSNKYAKPQKYAGIMNQAMFDYFMQIGRSSIVENKDLKESTKKQLLNELDNLKFKENYYLYFTMVYNMPFLDDELKLKFELLDNKKKNIVVGNTLIHQKLYQYGALVSVNYSYVIYTDQSVAEVLKTGASKFTVKFTDGTASTYDVQL
jgi:hypothetical protein